MQEIQSSMREIQGKSKIRFIVVYDGHLYETPIRDTCMRWVDDYMGWIDGSL